MSNKYEVLREKREAFRTFRESVVRPKLGLDDQELDNLSPQETASLIQDSETKAEYRKLCIELLEAVIEHETDDATPRPLPVRDELMLPLAAILMCAALAHYFLGMTAALAIAGLLLWGGSELNDRAIPKKMRDTLDHNKTVEMYSARLAAHAKSIFDLRRNP